MVLVLSYSKNKRDFENEMNGSKTDPGQMSQDFYESVAGPRRMYVLICGSQTETRKSKVLIADAKRMQRGATVCHPAVCCYCYELNFTKCSFQFSFHFNRGLYLQQRYCLFTTVLCVMTFVFG